MSVLTQPTVELVPPTPRAEHSMQAIAHNESRSRHSPSPTPSSSAGTPATSVRTNRTPRRRPSSSETTAVTIYSMYGQAGDDGPGPSLPTSLPSKQQQQPTQPPPPSAFADQHPRAPSRSHSRSSSRKQDMGGGSSIHGHTPSHSGHSNYRVSTASTHLAYLDGDQPNDPRTLSPPPIPKQLPQEAYLSPANGSKVSLATSPTSMSHRSPTNSLSLSLKRADSEDPDAFHVRATYATLEVSGVPGDGVDEGVERTRARLGVSLNDLAQSKHSLDQPRPGRTGDLKENEERLINSLDRYGFFQPDSSDRVVRMPKSALAKALSVAGAPAASAPSFAQLALSKVPQEDPTTGRDVEVRRIAKWGRMLEPRKRDEGSNVQLWTVAQRKEHKLRERVYKGIPDRWRVAAWEVLIRRYVGDRVDLPTLGATYRDTLDQPSKYDIQIDLDVPRTISGHIMFRTRYGQGQRSLFHVLHAFSLLCTECGYVQGMGPIAAALLCYYEPERVYAFLVQLHLPSGYNMHTIFAPGFPGLLEAIYVQERMMERKMPAVWTSFKKNMIATTSYATKWYITLFSNTVPFHTQLRIWDALFLEGPDVLVVLAVAIIWGFRDQLGSPTASFESVLSLLSSFFVPESDDALMYWVSRTMADKTLRADMKTWREQWRGFDSATRAKILL